MSFSKKTLVCDQIGHYFVSRLSSPEREWILLVQNSIYPKHSRSVPIAATLLLKKAVFASLCFPSFLSKIFGTCLLDFVLSCLESSCKTYVGHQWGASSITFCTWRHIIAPTIHWPEYERSSNLSVVAAFETGSFGALQWGAKKCLRRFLSSLRDNSYPSYM